MAASYGVAHAPDEFVPSNFSTPEQVPKIPDVVPRPPVSALEAVDEIPTTHDYYQGDLKLNVVKVHCTIYTTRADCIHVSGCGWCGSKNTCMLGNGFGPQEPCLKAGWIAAPPVANYNPTYNGMNMSGGVQMNVVSTPGSG
jgi:hypothetical protein